MKKEAQTPPCMLLFNTCRNILGKEAKLLVLQAARNNNVPGALEIELNPEACSR